jgi:hypothetical protein
MVVRETALLACGERGVCAVLTGRAGGVAAFGDAGDGHLGGYVILANLAAEAQRAEREGEEQAGRERSKSK